MFSNFFLLCRYTIPPNTQVGLDLLALGFLTKVVYSDFSDTFIRASRLTPSAQMKPHESVRRPIPPTGWTHILQDSSPARVAQNRFTCNKSLLVYISRRTAFQRRSSSIGPCGTSLAHPSQGSVYGRESAGELASLEGNMVSAR